MADRQHYLQCPICDEMVSATVVAAFDGEAEARLLASLVQGRLNRIVCPVCGHTGLAPEPVIVRMPSLGTIIGFMPVEVPRNRKAHLAARLQRQLEQSVGPLRTVKVCFGSAQLRRELPQAPWKGNPPEFQHRFDSPGAPRYRRIALNRALRKRPDDPVLLTRLGIALYDLALFREARKTLEEALARGPDQVDALYCLASVNLDDGNPAEAQRLYDRVVSATHDPVPRFLAGVAAYRAGQLHAALERLRQAAGEQPDLLEAHVWLAIVQLALDDKESAFASLRHAVENGLRDPHLILSHPEFQPVRSENAFKTLVALIERLHDRNAAKPGRPDHPAHHRRTRRGPRPARSRTH